MPYISQADRKRVEKQLGDFTPLDGGELQYAIATLVQRYYESTGERQGGVRYRHMEQMMGALSGALNEHYRCVVAPYEDKKIQENGGVYNVRSGESY